MSYKTKGKRTKPKRVGEITGEPATNVAIDRDEAAKMANLLEGLDFPARKEQILGHINRRIRHKKRDEDIGDIINRTKNYLNDKKQYNDSYEIEQAVGLVRHLYSGEPYVRDKALNIANQERFGEELRPDPYVKRNKKK